MSLYRSIKGVQVNKTEIEEKDNVSKDNARNMTHTGELNTCTYMENMDRIRQIGDITSSKHKHHGKS